MASSLEEATEMLKVTKECQVKLQLGFIRHFCHTWLKIQELVKTYIPGMYNDADLV